LVAPRRSWVSKQVLDDCQTGYVIQIRVHKYKSALMVTRVTR
jgi:hypothetical protein